MLLSIQNLEVRYGSNKALSITAPIELEEGDRVGVIGANGAGKTTLVKSILGLVPYEGTIRTELLPEQMAVHMQFNEYTDNMCVKYVMEAILDTDISKNKKLQELIDRLGCGDYVRLCGFQKLDEKYQEYDAYLSASYVETLGVTLLEAVGSGLPIVSYDMRYGAQAFIDEGENGYKVPWENVDELAKGIVRLFTEADMEAFRKRSYEKAEAYLTKEVEERWKNLLC